MKFVLLDGRYIGGTGIGVVAENIINEMISLDPPTRFVILSHNNSRVKDKINIRKCDKIVHVKGKMYSLREQIECHIINFKYRPTFSFWFHYTFPLFTNTKKAIFIHDSFQLYSEKNFNLSDLLRRVLVRIFIKKSLTDSNIIFFNSVFSMIDTLSRFGFNYKYKCHVVPFGWDHLIKKDISNSLDHEIPKQNESNKSILIVGGSKWHKNTDVIVNWLNNSEASHSYNLVFVGRGYQNTRFMHEISEDKQKQIKIIGDVEDQELQRLYQSCSVVVVPSYFEGFGLPVAEAIMSGNKVLCSKGGALPELFHEFANFFDPFNWQDFEKSINEITNENDIIIRKNMKTWGGCLTSIINQCREREIELW